MSMGLGWNDLKINNELAMENKQYLCIYQIFIL